jgi:selenide, water dikinase
MGPGDLKQVLAPLPRHADPRLLVGHETFDDAGVFRIADDVALVQTVDFFAPVVDDPFTFGEVAAANALSDVYAMGGEPLTALSIVGFPRDRAPLTVLTEILRGGQEKVREAGAFIVGGHTVVDDEIKFGLAVTGRAHPDRLLTNAGALPGDRLVLTKPLGVGILTTSLKRGPLAPEIERGLLDTMRRLNAVASRAALAVRARCATDITGFGLLGHASHIARASGVTLRIERAALPVLPGAREAWRAGGGRTGGADRNAQYLASLVAWGAASDEDRAVLVDPQTSGGLLVAVPADRLADYLSRVDGAVAIGEVLPVTEVGIELV